MPTGPAYENEPKCLKVFKLDQPGVFEFIAWSGLRFVNIAEKRITPTKSEYYMVVLDCPTARQVHYRLCALQGHGQLPIDEKWSLLTFVWPSRRSFYTLWMNSSCYGRKKEPKRGATEARMIELTNWPKEQLYGEEEDE